MNHLSRSADPANPLHGLASRLVAKTIVVVERVAGEERFFLRDQLDRKSTTVPALIEQALASESLIERRAVYAKARRVAQDCLAVLEVLDDKVDPPVLTAAQQSARALIEALGPLTVPPPLTR